jgi:hypothetical protein
MLIVILVRAAAHCGGRVRLRVNDQHGEEETEWLFAKKHMRLGWRKTYIFSAYFWFLV